MQVFTKNAAGPVGQGLAWIVCLPLALWFSSCASTSLPSLPSRTEKEHPIYVVMAEKAPFYLKRPSKGGSSNKTYPYLYLPKGTTVSMLKNGDPFSNVSLVNGMGGWVPILNLAPQMATDGEAQTAVTPVPAAGVQRPPATKAGGGFNPDNAVSLPSYD